MNSASSVEQQQPRLLDLQHNLPNILLQAAAENSSSAYAAPAVANKIHSANTTGPHDNMSAVMSDTGCDVLDSLNTEPVPDASARVVSLKDEHAALAASIPGQVDAQEHRSHRSLTLANSNCNFLHFSKLLSIQQHAAHRHMTMLSYARLVCSPVLAFSSVPISYCRYQHLSRLWPTKQIALLLVNMLTLPVGL